MNVLVACEFSGVVREAFRALGHNAWSCDLLSAEDDSPFHFQRDVLSILDGDIYSYGTYNGQTFWELSERDKEMVNQGIIKEDTAKIPWDMMIAFPPCTYLCSSGLHWNKRRPERQQMTEDALVFIRQLLDAPIPKIALENPIGCISTRIRKPDQIVQPWWFGEDASKATCLWLKNLPPLVPTNAVRKERYGNQTPSGQNKLGPSPDRWKERSRTFPKFAAAMANQWGSL